MPNHPRLPAPAEPEPPQSPGPQSPGPQPAPGRKRSAAKAPRGTLPAFTPVPRIHNRHDGWTPERQQGFIEALADLGSVKAAARHVGMTPEGAYLLRRHPEADGFRRAWEAALKCGVQRLEDVAMERALNGVEVPVYHFGAVVGTRRVHNDRLLMFMLRNRSRRRFAADSLANADAATQGQLKRLKREWQAEWEAEREAENARSTEELLDSLNAKLSRMHDARMSVVSPETRALERAYRASLRRDEEAGHRGDTAPDPACDEDPGHAGQAVTYRYGDDPRLHPALLPPQAPSGREDDEPEPRPS